MKNKITFSLIILLSVFANAQQHRNFGRGGMSRIEELEKIKLIEALNMDEQTTLKFFSRRTEYQNKIKTLNKNGDEQLDKLSDYINTNGNKNTDELKNIINNYLSTTESIIKERTKFINSLSDILTYEQISKLLVFEKKFRDEIRGILFRERM